MNTSNWFQATHTLSIVVFWLFIGPPPFILFRRSHEYMQPMMRKKHSWSDTMFCHAVLAISLAGYTEACVVGLWDKTLLKVWPRVPPHLEGYITSSLLNGKFPECLNFSCFCIEICVRVSHHNCWYVMEFWWPNPIVVCDVVFIDPQLTWLAYTYPGRWRKHLQSVGSRVVRCAGWDKLSVSVRHQYIPHCLTGWVPFRVQSMHQQLL